MSALIFFPGMYICIQKCMQVCIRIDITIHSFNMNAIIGIRGSVHVKTGIRIAIFVSAFIYVLMCVLILRFT